MEVKLGGFYSGASGLVLPVANKLLYPPEFRDKSRLEYYSSLFNSIEINSSFYKVPMAATVKKWADSVPEDFRFTFKVWKEVTHAKLLIFNEEHVTRFMQAVNFSGSKKGCLLIQFPPSLGMESFGQLGKLLNSIRNSDPAEEWRIAVEFRNLSWYNEEVEDLLEQYGAAKVFHDKGPAAVFMPDAQADFVYLRFHGPGGNYRGSYADDFLYEYAQYILDWKTESKEVFVYFNNTMGNAVQNLLKLNSYVSKENEY